MARSRRGSKKSLKSRKRRSDSGWKKSPLIAGVLGFVILVVWIMTIANSCSSGSGGGPALKDFPYTYMTEESHKVRVISSDKPKKVPFEDPEGSGELCWEAFICNNPDCPGRTFGENGESGKPYIFPHIIEQLKNPQPVAQNTPEGMPPEEYMYTPPFCPLCQEEGLSAYDVTRYLTPEGQERLKKWREEMIKKSKR